MSESEWLNSELQETHILELLNKEIEKIMTNVIFDDIKMENTKINKQKEAMKNNQANRTSRNEYHVPNTK